MPNQPELSLFYIGGFLAIGLYHLAMYSFRRQDRAPLYFGLYCLLWMGNTLLTDASPLAFRFFSLFLHSPPGTIFWMERLALICFILSLPAIYSFFRTLYPVELSARLHRLAWIMAAIYAVLGLALAPEPFGPVIRSYYLVTIGIILYTVTRLTTAWRQGREGAFLMLLGLVVLGLAGINDMSLDCWYPSPLPKPNLVSKGLFVFILLQAAALSQRFSKAFATVEELSAEREKHIASLSRLDRLKDEFLANTSHELRTPLNGIIGLAESLSAGAAGPLSAEACVNLEMISSSGRRLSSLVNDILDHARLKSRDLALHRTAVDLKAITAKVLAVIEPLAKGRRLRLVNDLPADLPLANGDEDRLQQILFNLVGNAVKFTDQGEVAVAASHSPDEIEVSVRDNGIGIPQEKLDTIFNAFEQVDGSAARTQGGVGLGLGISRQLVELHGGRLWVESTPGSGSTFSFTLPRSSEAALPDPVLAASDSAQQQPPVLHATALDPPVPAPASDPNAPRILAVDDDPVNLQVVRNHLGLEGMAVTLAATGPEALARIEAGEVFDLVLLDVMMPGMNGFEACRGIRRRYNAAELPVLMLTAKNRLTDLTEGLNSGANDYLGKPFAREELLARVQAQLKVRKAHEMTLENSRLRREIERRAQTELELRLGQRRLDGMLHALPEAIVAVNENREIAFCNQAFERSSGFAAEALLGQPLSRLLALEAAVVVEGWLSLLATGGEGLPPAGNRLGLATASGAARSCQVVPAALELETERLLLLFLSETPGPVPALRWIDDLSRNRQQLQHLEETLNGLTPLVLEKHPGFVDELRAVDLSLATLGQELKQTSPKEEQRRLIVEAMQLALDLWSESTQTSKAELARQSKQWSVYVNRDGWERTQGLDRYLSLDTLPSVPRLKTVLQTVEFVLEACPAPSPLRQRLAAVVSRLR